MTNENNKHLYMQEMNAQFILFMYYINYLYYKEKYEKSMSGTLTTALFGNEKEASNYNEAIRLYKSKENELKIAGYTEMSDSRIDFLVNKVFYNDNNFELRIKWAIEFVLFFYNVFPTEVLNRGFSSVSSKIYCHQDTLKNILSRYQNNYNALKINNNFNKALAIGAGVFSFVILCNLVPFITAKLPGALNVTLASLGGGALETGGLGMVGGITLLSATTGAISVGVGGLVYKAKTIRDKYILISELKNKNIDDFSYQLCFLMTFVEISKIFNPTLTESSKEILGFLIDLESEIKHDSMISYGGINQDLNDKVKTFRNLFVKLEKSFY